MKRLFLRDQKGFTLIELLIVIAIIAILASLAIPQYLKYQRKSKVSSYAEPIARACALDITAWCVENPGGTVTPNATLSNCSGSPFNTAGGSVTLTPPNSVGCNNQGLPTTNFESVATLENVSDYSAICTYTAESVKCTIKG